MDDAWNIVKNARKRNRIQSEEFISELFYDFIELKGDRIYFDDCTIIGGIAFYKDIPVTIIGFRKGKSFSEIINFKNGMAIPAGYNKALRLIKQAEKFSRPVIIFVDTPGAYPGEEAEEKGQAYAISLCLKELSHINTKIISIIISEAYSGGALALCVSDKLYMLENSCFSILSPEGYASILWKNNDYIRAANEMKLTSEDMFKMGIIDGIVPETDRTSIIDSVDELLYYDLFVNTFSIENRLNKLRYMDVGGVYGKK